MVFMIIDLLKLMWYNKRITRLLYYFVLNPSMLLYKTGIELPKCIEIGWRNLYISKYIKKEGLL